MPRTLDLIVTVLALNIVFPHMQTVVKGKGLLGRVTDVVAPAGLRPLTAREREPQDETERESQGGSHR